jgi:hypothetical protein
MPKLKIGDVCAVKVKIDGAWVPQCYFAKIVKGGCDANDNWSIDVVRIFGENFDRDDGTMLAAYRIEDADKQAAALKLAGNQWGQLKAYADFDSMRAAILEIAPNA